jgi:hypothetical protein
MLPRQRDGDSVAFLDAHFAFPMPSAASLLALRSYGRIETRGPG